VAFSKVVKIIDSTRVSEVSKGNYELNVTSTTRKVSRRRLGSSAVGFEQRSWNYLYIRSILCDMVFIWEYITPSMSLGLPHPMLVYPLPPNATSTSWLIILVQVQPRKLPAWHTETALCISPTSFSRGILFRSKKFPIVTASFYIFRYPANLERDLKIPLDFVVKLRAVRPFTAYDRKCCSIIRAFLPKESQQL